MQLISLSKLNNACGSSFGNAVIRQVKSGEQRNLSAHLYFHGQICSQRNSSLRFYSSHRFNKSSAVNPSSSPFCCVLERKAMSSYGSQAVSRGGYVDGLVMGSGNVRDSAKPTSVLFSDASLHSCRRASGSLRNQMTFSFSLGTSGVVARRGCYSRFFREPCSRQFHVSCSASSGAAADVPIDISVRDEQLVKSADTSACKHVDLKLKSGSYYLPHPEKVKTGGEDAHFICEEKQVIGVADGVGGWAEVGVDAGFYARLLMSNSVTAIEEESKGSVDPAKVLEKAYANTKVLGSSTACIVALTDQGINAINLGDSAFIVIRDGNTVFRSPVQQYGFNFPYQLGFGNGGDSPSSGQVFTFPVAPGDVIVAGTDGLFDNMYDNEITTLVVQAMRAGLEPQVTAQNIANLAQERAKDCHRQTPFSAAAHDAGLRYVGGKLDDITVVVSYIAGEN
ncbi:hypothetical protein RND81_13G169100 [Saponaria officinalis]|uniref:Protein phosphatase n=1 Tax=Saponaria officinalis TaxID=3572 RepID=A0AAW1H6K2_SAPOF